MWKETNEGLEAEFEFEDFVEAFAFMTRVAGVAEEQQHHPEEPALQHVRQNGAPEGADDAEEAEALDVVFRGVVDRHLRGSTNRQRCVDGAAECSDRMWNCLLYTSPSPRD